jgi:hypothetical protein
MRFFPEFSFGEVARTLRDEIPIRPGRTEQAPVRAILRDKSEAEPDD